jgi:DNA-3-methyladenine glycosylase
MNIDFLPDAVLLPSSFYQRDTVQVARDLLGAVLVRVHDGHVIAGIIAETEAYCGELDPASHAYKRQTPRNKAMFGPVGHSYVYFTYGNHYCLNLVAKPEGQKAGGVLIRGLIPLCGIEHMRRNRGVHDLERLTSGPGNVGKALQLTRDDNHIDVTKRGELFVVRGVAVPDADVLITPRIGISKAQDKLWRFVIKEGKRQSIVVKRIAQEIMDEYADAFKKLAQ